MTKLSLDERLELARKKEQQAKARRQDLENRAGAEKRRAENGEKFIVGATCLNAMERDPDFGLQVARLLDQYVTKSHDRERVKRWLPRQQ